MTDTAPRRSPIAVLELALDHARLLLIVPLLAGAVALGLSLLLGRQYVASSSFKPQDQDQSKARGLAGLAAQFGVSAVGVGQGESVDFYARLARSRALLEQVARSRYRFARGELSRDTLAGDLVQLYRVRGRTAADRLSHAVDILDQSVTVEADAKSGIVALRTVAPWPGLAVQVNRALLDGINRFNLEKRQSQAAAERRFVEGEAGKAQRDLEASERDLAGFLEHNRLYEQWPPLRVEAARRQRRVDLNQQVYANLAQMLEQARVDEVRNTPVLTVIDPPEGSVHARPVMLRNAVLGIVLGLAAVILFLFVREYGADVRQRFPEDYARLRQRRRVRQHA